MFVRKLILLCLTLALLAPLASAKTPKPPKPNHPHKVRSHKAKFKKPKANWGSHNLKTKN